MESYQPSSINMDTLKGMNNNNAFNSIFKEEMSDLSSKVTGVQTSDEQHDIENKESEKQGRTAIIRNFIDGTTMDELEQKFREFGLVNKVTMMCDKLTGKPKSTAYIEFEDKDSRNDSLQLNGTMYKNKMIHVTKQIKTIPITAGKQEKCYNENMQNYFEGSKNNFGPIRLRRKIHLKKNPY